MPRSTHCLSLQYPRAAPDETYEPIILCADEHPRSLVRFELSTATCRPLSYIKGERTHSQISTPRSLITISSLADAHPERFPWLAFLLRSVVLVRGPAPQSARDSPRSGWFVLNWLTAPCERQSRFT
jgi:hypothetical protein